MRASEFITETFHPTQDDALPGLKEYPGINQFYELYRLGLAMARTPSDLKGEKQGPVEDNPFTLSYTDAEERIINAALATMGIKGKQVTDRKSNEPTDTYTQSPMKPQGPVRRKSS